MKNIPIFRLRCEIYKYLNCNIILCKISKLNKLERIKIKEAVNNYRIFENHELIIFPPREVKRNCYYAEYLQDFSRSLQLRYLEEE